MGLGDSGVVRTTLLSCPAFTACSDRVASPEDSGADACGVPSLSEARVRLQAVAVVISSSSSKKRRRFIAAIQKETLIKVDFLYNN